MASPWDTLKSWVGLGPPVVVTATTTIHRADGSAPEVHVVEQVCPTDLSQAQAIDADTAKLVQDTVNGANLKAGHVAYFVPDTAEGEQIARNIACAAETPEFTLEELLVKELAKNGLSVEEGPSSRLQRIADCTDLPRNSEAAKTVLDTKAPNPMMTQSVLYNTGGKFDDNFNAIVKNDGIIAGLKNANPNARIPSPAEFILEGAMAYGEGRDFEYFNGQVNSISDAVKIIKAAELVQQKSPDAAIVSVEIQSSAEACGVAPAPTKGTTRRVQ